MFSEGSTITTGLVIVIAGFAFWLGKLSLSLIDLIEKFKEHAIDDKIFHTKSDLELSKLRSDGGNAVERLAGIEAKIDFLIIKFNK